MVVALGAVDRQAQERLGHRLGHLLRVLVQGVEIRRAVLVRAAGGGDDLAGELVPRRVRGDALANPVVVRLERLRPQPLAGEQQQVGPFVGPVIDELRPRQQASRSAGRACRRDASARNARASSAVGSVPIVSR